MKKSNNKGFSLVELIVVVAIMAVLVGVLAPAYLKYVENSRASKDENNVEEVRHAIEIALADETVYDNVETGATVTITDGSIAYDAKCKNDKLKEEVAKVVNGAVDLGSNKYKDQEYEITITIGDTVKVEGKWNACTCVKDDAGNRTDETTCPLHGAK